MSLEGDIYDKWIEIRKLVEIMNSDILKSIRGVHTAGVRARKCLRQLQYVSRELVSETLENERVKKSKSLKKKKESKDQ